MKKIPTTDAIGHVICHDITRIIRGVTKEVAFKKGHVVKARDIPDLLRLGKDNLYVWEKTEGTLHEDEAAHILYSLCAGPNLSPTPVKEGRIDIVAEIDGLYRVDTVRLEAINMLDEIIISSRNTNINVRRGEKLAGTRVIPLVIDEARLAEARSAAGSSPIMELLPYKKMKTAIITTGSEVYHGRIADTFTPVILSKLLDYGLEAVFHRIVDDNRSSIASAIGEAHGSGAELIICTGGMSVDPDDMTPGAIRDSGAEIISYGAPVLPGAMLLLGYFPDGAAVLGLPGCVMYAKATVFDLLLPRIAAGVGISRRDIAAMGHGGYCMGCTDCRFPNCAFGDGGSVLRSGCNA